MAQKGPGTEFSFPSTMLDSESSEAIY